MSERECERRHEEGVGLLRGFANRDLTRAERERLAELCSVDPAIDESVRGVERLHEDFAAERSMLEELVAPVRFDEDSEEGYARLAAAAAGAEDRLRAQLRHGAGLGSASAPHGLARDRGFGYRGFGYWGFGRWIAAAALLLLGGVVIAVLAASGGGSATEGLLQDRPGEGTLGTSRRIVMSTELRLDDPVLQWHAVVGASSYRAVIADAAGDTLLTRPASAATAWEFEPAEVGLLRASLGRELRLRVVALDGDGMKQGSTGDLPLRLVD